MAWEIFVDDCFCRIVSTPSGGYRVSIFHSSWGDTDRIMLPPGTSLDDAKAAAHRRIIEESRRLEEGQTLRITGNVKWYNDAVGYGFIRQSSIIGGAPGIGSEIVNNDVFVHWSSILAEGKKTLVLEEPVEFELRKVDRGYKAAQLTRLESPDSANFRELLQLRRDRIAVAMIEGSLRVVRISPERKALYLDSNDRYHGLLYVPRPNSRIYYDAIAELESLINQSSVKEQALHDFFERYPEFILPDDYKAAHSKIALESEEQGDLIPDFILEPIGQKRLCDLLELKLPTSRVEVLQDRRERFSATVLEACAQLRTYRDYFDDKANRDRFKERYGLEAFRPRMYVIMGRRGSMEPIEWRRIEDDLPMLNVKTYDDILDRAKHILDRFGTLKRAE